MSFRPLSGSVTLMDGFFGLFENIIVHGLKCGYIIFVFFCFFFGLQFPFKYFRGKRESFLSLCLAFPGAKEWHAAREPRVYLWRRTSKKFVFGGAMQYFAGQRDTLTKIQNAGNF